MHPLNILPRELLLKICLDYSDWNISYEALQETDKAFYNFCNNVVDWREIFVKHLSCYDKSSRQVLVDYIEAKELPKFSKYFKKKLKPSFWKLVYKRRPIMYYPLLAPPSYDKVAFNEDTEIKLSVFGAGGVGKSTIVMQLICGIFCKNYDPTIEDSFRKDFIFGGVNGTKVLVEILDTAGTEQFTAMRSVYKTREDGILVIFSPDRDKSLEAAEGAIEQEYRIYDRKLPTVLVLNKIDLEEERQVSLESGKKLAEAHGIPLVQTSAKTGEGVHKAFLDLMELVAADRNQRFPKQPKRKSQSCIAM